jgi:hypothetical protein
MRIHHTTHLGRIVGTVVTALALSTAFAGTAAATIDSPGTTCNSPACPVKKTVDTQPKGIEGSSSGSNNTTTIPTTPDKPGCPKLLCF